MKIVDQNEESVPAALAEEPAVKTTTKPHRRFIPSANQLIIGVSILLCLVIIIFFIVPSIKNIIDLRDRITAERIKLGQFLAAGKTMKKLISDYESVRKDLGALDGTMLKPGQELQFIETLEALARTTQTSIEISFNPINTDGSEELKQPIPIPTHVRLNGRYHNILVFLDKLEMLDFYSTLESFRATAVTQTRTSGIIPIPPDSDPLAESARGIQAEITLTTYWQH